MSKNEIEHLRAEAADVTKQREVLGRKAGLSWAPVEGTAALRRLAVAAGQFATVREYVSACASTTIGLAARVYPDIAGPRTGASGDGAEVNWF
jgi:hypothetical protein